MLKVFCSHRLSPPVILARADKPASQYSHNTVCFVCTQTAHFTGIEYRPHMFYPFNETLKPDIVFLISTPLPLYRAFGRNLNLNFLITSTSTPPLSTASIAYYVCKRNLLSKHPYLLSWNSKRLLRAAQSRGWWRVNCLDSIIIRLCMRVRVVVGQWSVIAFISSWQRREGWFSPLSYVAI